jgi:polysaccharide export outer membrane protein
MKYARLLTVTIMRTEAKYVSALGSLLILIGCNLIAQAPASQPTDDGTSGPAAAALTAQSTKSTAAKPHDNIFVIGADDVLAINVWKEPDLSRSIPVRSDGMISLPLVGEVLAAGRTPLELEKEIVTRLRNYVTEPEVTVMVQQINSEKFNILGQVTKPGSYPLTATTTIVDAIAIAGGFRDFAKKKGIYILRHAPDGSEFRISFNYQEFIKGKNSTQNIMLQPHDTVIVP